MRLPSLPPVGALLRARLLGALLPLCAVTPAAAQVAPPPEVRSISFVGSEQVPEPLLRLSIGTRETTCVTAALLPLCWLGLSLDRRLLDERMLAADVVRLRILYYQTGYREAQVALDTAHSSDGVDIRFRIAEGEPLVVSSVQVEGADSFPRSLTRNLPLRAGGPLSMIAFEATRDSLTARLANRGHAAADVLASYMISADDPYVADVAYTLIPGTPVRFGPITVTGTSRVGPDVVRNMLLFEEGDEFTRQALLRSQRNLFTLELFRHAEIVTPVHAETDTVLPVEVRIVEGDMHRVRVGVGVSTSDYVNAEGRWIARNLFGRARRLEIRGRVSNIAADRLGAVKPFDDCSGIYCDLAGSLAADFSRPWLLSPLSTGGAGLFLERFSLPGVYVRTTVGGYLSLRRTLGQSGTATIGWRPELTRLESDGDLIFCVNFTACEERDIDVLRQRGWLAPVAATFALDRSNSVVSPTAGYILRADAEYGAGWTGSEFDYARSSAEASIYHDPFRGVVLASRLRAGWARSLSGDETGLGVHPQKRFFGGGPNSVRGYAQYRLGPKLLTVNARRDLAAPVESGGAGCTAQQINLGACDASALARIGSDRLEQRPVGGTVMVEGNVEMRFPVWRELLRGAVFMDFGQVWQGTADVRAGSVQWTPGLGVRYFSPIGPVRIDIGYNPAGAERLDVVTTEVCDNRTPAAGCVDIDPAVAYSPDQLGNRRKLRAQPSVTWRQFDGFRDRLQFHFSIGQAF